MPKIKKQSYSQRMKKNSEAIRVLRNQKKNIDNNLEVQQSTSYIPNLLD